MAEEDLFTRWASTRAPAQVSEPSTPPATPTVERSEHGRDDDRLESAGVSAGPASGPSEASGPDTRDAGRAVLAAFLADHPVPTTAAPDPAPRPVVEREDATSATADAPAPPVAGPPAQRPPRRRARIQAREPQDQDPSARSIDASFPLRRGAQRTIGVALGVSLAATAWTTYRAVVPGLTDDTPTLGLAITCAALTLVLWAVRASMPATDVAIRRGLLEVHRGAQHWSIDLTNPHAPAELVGRPRGRRWRIRFPRLDQDPLVLDASMVDPDDFTDAVLRFRPDLTPVLRP